MFPARLILDWAVYRALLVLAAPFIAARLAWRGLRERGYWRHLAERAGFAPRLARGALWIHAVSVGEMRAAGPLIDALRAAHPGLPLVLTCMTATGRATAAALYGDVAQVCYLPYDYRAFTRRFLRRVAPRVGVVMETEWWPNLIAAARAAGVPTVLANARLSEKSARGYARLPALSRATLGGFAAIGAQTAADAGRLQRLGAHDVTVTGNLKFDITPPADLLERGRGWRRQWGAARPVLLAASTREGEEAAILNAFVERAPAELLLVLVPRHPQRFDAVATLLETLHLRFARRSAQADPSPLPGDVRVILGDSLGELFAYYAAADVAFIGGSLARHGGQNLIEAASVGCPILVGPHTWNFDEATRLAIECGAAQRIRDAEALLATAVELLENPARREAMRAAGIALTSRERGAAARTAALISPWLASDGDRCPPDHPRPAFPPPP